VSTAAKKIKKRRRRPVRVLTVVDVYAGCGGVTTGLKKAGFQVVAAIDNDPIACETYRLNHPEVEMFERDVRRIRPKQIQESLGNRRLDLMVVCAPCQPFSSQNRRKRLDERAHLILQAIRFAKALRPRAIFFENVPGLARERASAILQKLRDGLERAGYRLSEPVNVDAADFGVPQRRRRCILIATHKKSLPEIPKKATRRKKRRTVRDAIGSLPRLRSGQAYVPDLLHFARNHSPIALKRLALIPKNGGSRNALPPRLCLACHRKQRGHEDVYGRMRWNATAPTLTTGCTDITKGRYAHPRDDRAITLREAACLQTFPRRYKFAGNPSQVAMQIGNAVPVELVRTLSPTLVKAIRKSDA
jgi:DNA (cytosine-5)-methyltransferase 1